MPRQSLEKFRGKPTIKIRRKKEGLDVSAEGAQDNIQVYSMPPGTTVEQTLQYLKQEQLKQDKNKPLNTNTCLN